MYPFLSALFFLSLLFSDPFLEKNYLHNKDTKSEKSMFSRRYTIFID